MTTGEAITQWRKYRRMSQEALAAASGLTRQTIYAYESNRHSPTVPILLRIVKAVGADGPDHFLAGPGSPVGSPVERDTDIPRPVHTVEVPLYDGVPAGGWSETAPERAGQRRAAALPLAELLDGGAGEVAEAPN